MLNPAVTSSESKMQMQMSRLVPILFSSLALMAGACSSTGGTVTPPSDTGGKATTGGSQSSSGGAASSGGATSSGGSSASGGAPTNGGATSAGGASGGASGSGGAVATGGSSGRGGATGSGGNTGSGGSTVVGGSMVAGGSAASGGNTSVGGSTGSGGASTTGGSTGAGGSHSGGTTGSGGTTALGGTTSSGGATSTGGTTSTGTGVTVSASCKISTWPTATGTTVNISGTKSVTNYDGGGALHEGDLNDCSIGDQKSTTPIFEVADGGSVKNVVFGKNIGDGIHCLGSCTIDNVWFPYICDDAITVNKDGTASKASTISNSGFKGARDKTIQHNGGSSTLNISNVYAEVAGKLYRSCGSGGGCTTSATHTVNISNVVAMGVNQVAGVSENDKVTLSNICTYRTAVLCNTYQVNSDNDSTKGANGTGEGPSPNCSYSASDTHALVDHVNGVATTDVLCTGSNSAKTGATATACVPGFDTCLKTCAPGMYGFKQLTCSGGKYTSAATGACLPATDSTANAQLFAGAAAKATATTTAVTKNTTCSTQWAWGTDSSTSGNYCACVEKPGYYQTGSTSSGGGMAQPATWIVWDCQSPWW
jgi:hypothetical protein